MAKPVEIGWELETPASAEAAWALFADTDRYNRAVGFGYSFQEELRPDGTVKRTGQGTALGFMGISWEERPFRYRVPEWFESTRLFDGTPAERLVTSLSIKDLGDKRAIRYTISVTPRSLLGRPLAAIELRINTRSKIDAVIQSMLARLRGEDAAYDPLPPPLSIQAEERLLSLVPRVPAPTGERLASYLRQAPLSDQAQIQPLRLAEEWDVPQDRLLDGLLIAVREGLLNLRWDLLCPDCRGPKHSLQSLSELKGMVHCPSCNIDYDGSFPDSIVVSFRPVPELRDIDIPVACIGSPYRQPHVLAQENIEISGSKSVQLTLKPGAYRLRTLPGKRSVSLIVREGVPKTALTLRVGKGKLAPARLLTPPGPLSLTVDNYSDQAVELLVEDRSMPPGVLTIGRLMERPRAKELLPPESLMPGMDVETRQGVVLALEALDLDLDLATRVVGQAMPTLVQIAPQGLVAVWPDLHTALGVARTLSRESGIQLALNLGAVTVVNMGSKVLAMGRTVEAALSALVGAAEGHAAIPVDRAKSPQILAVLDNRTKLIEVDFPLSTGVRVHWIQFL
jgi:hypothetical protein